MKQMATCLNVWVSDHELGQLGGQKIVFALDVWEHAYTVDYKPTERMKICRGFLEESELAKG
jgi:Fe-Mn family superoxide dismutase